MTTVVHPSDGVIVCMCTYVMRALRIRKAVQLLSVPATNFSYKIQSSYLSCELVWVTCPENAALGIRLDWCVNAGSALAACDPLAQRSVSRSPILFGGRGRHSIPPSLPPSSLVVRRSSYFPVTHSEATVTTVRPDGAARLQ